MKKFILLILTAFILLTFSSCGLDYRHSLDENKHNKIEVFKESDELSYIIYKDDKYVFAGTTNLFNVNTYLTEDGSYTYTYKEDILLSWNGYRYVGYIDDYYSNTADSPLFIYSNRLHEVYFREDYDYHTDTFLIENFSDKILWDNIFGSLLAEINFESQISVKIHSAQYPRIIASIEIACIDGCWYARLPDNSTVYALSSEFVDILSKNEII